MTFPLPDARPPGARLPIPRLPRLSSAQLPAALFFAKGLIFVSFFTRLPEIGARLGLGADRLGLAMLGMTAGTVAGFVIAARVVERAGPRRAAGAGLLGMGLGLVWATGGGWDGSAAGMAACLLLFGFAGAIFEVGTNLIAARIEATGRRVLARSHGFWSVGLLVGTMLTGVATARGLAPPLQQLIASLLSLPLAVALVLRLGELPPPARDAGPRPPLFARPDRFVLCLLLLIVGFSVTEGAIYDWGMFYLARDLQLPGPQASSVYLCFTLGMIAIRMVGDGLRARLRLVTMLRAMAGTVLAGLALLAAAPHLPLATAVLGAGFALVGAGVALAAPVAVGLALSQPGRSGPETMAAYALVSLLATFCLPPLLGHVVAGPGGALLALWLPAPVVLAVLVAAPRVLALMLGGAPRR